MTRALILLSHDQPDPIYGPDEVGQIARQVELVSHPVNGRGAVDPVLLKEVEVIFSGGKMPDWDGNLLRAASRLQAIFHAGELSRNLIPDEFWSRQVRLFSSDRPHRLALADYAVGAILFGLKHGFRHAAYARKHGRHCAKHPVAGTFESVIGLAGLGPNGRLLLERLRPFDLQIIVHDPRITPAQAAEMGIELASLEELFLQADAVSVHETDRPDIGGLIRGAHFASMKHGATFINTTRGNEREMLEQMRQREDLTAILDAPADPSAGALPNVVRTPQIAGGQRGLGRCMIEEYLRWSRGQPLLWEITKGEVVCRG